jgi:tetratricopeptide (TPR) repeat protein
METVLERHKHRFGQFVAIAIVVTTLLAALCEYVEAGSQSAQRDSLTLAQQWGAFSTQVAHEESGAQQLLLARYYRANEDRLAGGWATGAARFGSPPSGQPPAAPRWMQLAAMVEKDSVNLAADTGREIQAIHRVNEASLLDGEALRAGDGPGCPLPPWAGSGPDHLRTPPAVAHNALGEGADQDPFFPRRYLVDDRRELYQLAGLRDAANTEAAEYEKRFRRYAVSLATLAVAVFLFGYCLTPHGHHHRKLYALMAGIFVAGASLWGVYTAVRSPHRISAQAMGAYADGRVAFDRGDFPTAVRYLTCAVSQEPGFAPAWEWRAQAYGGLAQTFYELPPRDLAHALGDAQRARDLGLQDPLVLNTLSAAFFTRGLRSGDQGQVLEARGLLGRARRLDPRDPTIAFNYAEDLVLLGGRWKAAYETATGLDVSEGVYALESLQNDLETPLGRRHRDVISAAKQYVAAALSRGSAVAGTDDNPPVIAPGGAPSLDATLFDHSTGQSTISPAQAEFFLLGGHGFDPRHDRLYAAWYAQVPGAVGTTWKILPPSPTGPTGPVTGLKPADGGRLFSLSSGRGDCLTSGTYRLELYVNGVLAGETTQQAHVTSLEHAALPDMNFSMCHPRAWRRVRDWTPGLLEGYQDPSGAAAALVVDATPAGRLSDPPAAVLHAVLRRIGGTLPRGLHTPVAENVVFGGFCKHYAEEQSFPGGTLAAGIGTDAGGRELIGLLYGPNSAFASHGSAPSLAGDIFFSLISSQGSC